VPLAVHTEVEPLVPCRSAPVAHCHHGSAIWDRPFALAFFSDESGGAEVEGSPANRGAVDDPRQPRGGSPISSNAHPTPGAADEVWTNRRAESRPRGVPVRWLDIDDTLVRRARAIKARGRLNYADAFAARAASALDYAVLTGDPKCASVPDRCSATSHMATTAKRSPSVTIGARLMSSGNSLP
jgi:hypothetical protein